MFKEEEQKFLLGLARSAISEWLSCKKLYAPSLNDIPADLKNIGASFVTLTIDFELRGCIGSLEAALPLWEDVRDNAIAAAFKDPRFFELKAEELPELSISISVSTKPMPLAFSNADDLLSKLEVGVDGVVLKRGDKSATYLPQVWDEILEKENFLSSLCIKADLPPQSWREPGQEIAIYRVETFSE